MEMTATRLGNDTLCINEGKFIVSLSVDEAKELARQLVRETGMPLSELLRQHTGGDQARKLRAIAAYGDK
jgi:hypothetical protein